MEDRLIYLVSVNAFIATMHAKRTHDYKLNLPKLGLDLDLNMAGDILIATRPEPTVPEPYRAHEMVFIKADSESMPSYCPHNLAIKLLIGKQQLWGPIYNLSEKELDTFCSSPEAKLKQ